MSETRLPQSGIVPLLSVPIATRNCARYLPRAIDSALRAGAALNLPFEIVIADDASTDETREIMERYRLHYPDLVRLVYRSTTRGVSVAKNTAMGHCIGRYVAPLDADDEFLVEKLVRCFAAIAEGGEDLITHDCIYWRINGDHYRMDWTSWVGADIDFWPPSSWVFPNGRLRFNEQMMGGAEDLEWLHRQAGTLRRRHLCIPLNIQYEVPGHIGGSVDSLVPARQVVGRILGRPHDEDRRAPTVQRCNLCGFQYLLPTTCCGRATSFAPLLYYQIASSPSVPESPPEFSFLFLTRNQIDLTRRAVESLLPRLGDASAELIFVDGGSTDGTLDAIRAWAAILPVKLVSIPPEEPFNYSRNGNRGARAAIGTYLILVNNDIEVCSDDLVETLRAALSDRRVGVAGVATSWHTSQREPEWDRETLPYVFTQRPPCGFFWGCRREVFWELGGLDVEFTEYGYEELDFEYRAIQSHYRLALVAARVAHKGAATFKSVYDTPTLSALAQGNRAVFEQKHGVPIHCSGEHVVPFAQTVPPQRSVVMVAHNAADALRQTLAAVAREMYAHDGSTQLVVVNNGSHDGTALALAEYRRHLPRLLSILDLTTAIDPLQATALGEARAIGATIQIRHPGDLI